MSNKTEWYLSTDLVRIVINNARTSNAGTPVKIRLNGIVVCNKSPGRGCVNICNLVSDITALFVQRS